MQSFLLLAEKNQECLESIVFELGTGLYLLTE